MSKWITDRPPKLEEATNEGDVWVYDIEADEYYIRNYEEVIKGQPWMEIPPPEPYVKPSRFEVYGAVGSLQVWGIRDNDGFDIIGFVSRDHAKRAIKELDKLKP